MFVCITEIIDFPLEFQHLGCGAHSGYMALFRSNTVFPTCLHLHAISKVHFSIGIWMILSATYASTGRYICYNWARNREISTSLATTSMDCNTLRKPKCSLFHWNFNDYERYVFFDWALHMLQLGPKPWNFHLFGNDEPRLECAEEAEMLTFP